jgi:predicted nucleic acid-binding protein
VKAASDPELSEPELLVDTSVAVALSVADHEAHPAVLAAVAGRRIGLAGHAAFESFSVLTRLPAPARRTPAAVSRLLAANFPYSRFLSQAGTSVLLSRLADAGVSGGAVYDALVGATAVEHRVRLLTRDLRALATYRALEVDVLVAR